MPLKETLQRVAQALVEHEDDEMKINDLEQRQAWLAFASATLSGLGGNPKKKFDQVLDFSYTYVVQVKLLGRALSTPWTLLSTSRSDSDASVLEGIEK